MRRFFFLNSLADKINIKKKFSFIFKKNTFYFNITIFRLKYLNRLKKPKAASSNLYTTNTKNKPH